MPVPFSPSCPVVPVSPSNSSTDEITPPVSSNVQSDSSSGPESDFDIERGPQPTPDQGAWKSFLDADGDGTISSRDLVSALFLVGATLSVAEFEELHKKVQVDSGAFSKFVVTNEGPEALQKRYLNEEKLYLEGTWPSRQFKTIMMLSYVFLLPMLNIDWPIRLVEAKNVTDMAWIKTMKWNAGLSFQCGIWFLWIPSFVLFYVFKPPSIHIADILTPAFLYLSHICLLFTAWAGNTKTREGKMRTLNLHKNLYPLNYVKICDPAEKMRKKCPPSSSPMIGSMVKVTSASEYLQELARIKNGGGPSSEKSDSALVHSFDNDAIDQRFLDWKLKSGSRRASQVERSQTKLTSDLQASHNPYQHKTRKRSMLAIVTAATLPFIVRFIDSRSVFGESASARIINVLNTILTAWCWYCLTEVMVKQCNHDSVAMKRMYKNFADHTVLAMRNSVERRGTKSSAMTRPTNKPEPREDLILDLTITKNIKNLLTMYSVIGMLLGKWVTASSETLSRGLLVVQTLLATGFVFLTIFPPWEDFPLIVTANVLLETALALCVLLDVMVGLADINKFDDEMRSHCASIATELRLLDDTTDAEYEVARRFELIAEHLKENHVVSAKLFGVRVTKQLTGKIIGSLAAATISAAIRTGLERPQA